MGCIMFYSFFVKWIPITILLTLKILLMFCLTSKIPTIISFRIIIHSVFVDRNSFSNTCTNNTSFILQKISMDPSKFPFDIEENHEGENLPPELNQILEQIERERFLHIQKSFADRPSVVTQAAYHQSLASTRGAGVINDGGDNNMLSLRMKTPLHIFKYNPGKEFTSPIPKEQVIKLPIVKQLPRAITWLLTDSNKLMAESDSVIGKKQIIYVNGQAEELSSDDEEETEKEKLEFSKDANRFIWLVGQKHNLDDLVVRSALTKFFELDISVILERYNDLKKLKINEGDIGEVSDIRIFTCYPETTERRFCRRCLRFDCREHEEYQPEVYTKENHSILFEKEDVRKQCSNHCYLKLRGVTEADHLVDNDNSVSNKKGKNVISGTKTETGHCVLTDTNKVINEITEMSQAYNEWTPVEIDLYLKGAKLFGRNSCLITRNTLTGLKTCSEVHNYMREKDQCNMLLEHEETSETDNQVNKETSRKKRRLVRKKVKLQKHICYPAAIKNTMNKREKSYKHYTPCTCEPVCGDQCPCFRNGNCCEIYCGCPKTCNNRFGGCNCTKGQCINRKCPCFSNSRECNPDLCRSCSLSCGDGHDSLGETSKTRECKNMQFLLKKHKKILLGMSDVHGWGAYARHPLKRNEFLGEYTGDLVSIDEAEERDRADDKLGYSYIFNLNDKFVIDSRRQGSKLRFLNHSTNPNCYAKLMIVKGDHKIGLFAAKTIREGEELVFEYKQGEADPFPSNSGGSSS
ncbi:hypothetical protein Bca52824_079778 [Brassica carinata]|uniref:Uncharacterized protein n=1 Tax=Brassica carinata TaxID=52824 RepID=A0A8X7Q3P6_BRACI|nr:hypothetical protein Bca52824_079778 [Brassica carinata]